MATPQPAAVRQPHAWPFMVVEEAGPIDLDAWAALGARSRTNSPTTAAEAADLKRRKREGRAAIAQAVNTLLSTTDTQS